MSQIVEKLITTLKQLDVEEKRIKELRSDLMQQLKQFEEQLDQICSRRSSILKELESANNMSTDLSESEFQSLCSDNSIYPKSSDLDSDEFTQKRRKRSDSTGSDVETKKARNDGTDLLECPNTIEEVNNFDQNMVNRFIDEMANKVIKEISGPDIRLKGELEKLSEDPDFESLVKDVEKDIKSECISKADSLTQTSPSLLSSLYRSNSTDGNFKENTSPSKKVRRTSSNRFKFDHQSVNSDVSANKSGTLSPTIVPSKVLKGKKILSKLLSDKQSIDEKREKSFSQKVEITSRCFKENMFFWERKANEEGFIQKQKNPKSDVQIKDIVDAI